MFRGSYQKKLLTILYSGGSNPLEIWDVQVKNGWTRRVKDEELGCIVFEICGTNVATAYIISPPDPRSVLGISLPFITMFIKNLKRYFTFEIQIMDDKQMRRRFRFSNYQSSTKVRPFTCSVPLALKPGWNQMQLNLANFTTRAYGTNYMETQRVQIHANCRIRRVYFSDRLYAEEELPRDYRIYLNVRQVPPQPSQEGGKQCLPLLTQQDSQASQPISILKKGSKASISKDSVLLGKISLRGSKMDGVIPAEDRIGQVAPETKVSAHSLGSRRSQKISKEISMSVIAEEKEPQTPGDEGIGMEPTDGGEEAEGAEPATGPEGEEGAEVPVEQPVESPGDIEEAATTEDESPRTEETESPRSDMPESEVAESEPIPESEAAVLESQSIHDDTDLAKEAPEEEQ